MKILVVDDEVPIRKYITQMILDCGSEYEIIGSVSSGKKALEVIKEQIPDLVLADITMSKMNGLELLERIKAENPEVDVFMLTCHNDFEFARTAIKLQAGNYILKDEISVAYMGNLLKSAQEKRENAVRQSLHRLESDSYFIQLMEREDTLLFDSYDLEKHKIFLKDKAFIVISATNSDENLQKIISFKSSILQNQEIFPYQETNIILIANLITEHIGKLHENVQEMVYKLRKETSGCIGVSAIYYKIHMLRQAVFEAGASYNYEYYQRPTQHLNAKQAEIRKNKKIEMQRYISQTHNLIRESKYKKLFDLISEIMEDAFLNNVDIYLLKKTLNTILADYKMQSGIKTDLNQITLAKNITELKEYLDILSNCFAVNSIQYSQAISDALNFIEKNYGENITLSEMAEKVHLNQDYFSRRFKKETGVNFSEYLLQIRMEEAKQLLMTTKMTITEISRNVGFNNDSYFSATFKKVYGENPNELRKKQ